MVQIGAAVALNKGRKGLRPYMLTVEGCAAVPGRGNRITAVEQTQGGGTSVLTVGLGVVGFQRFIAGDVGVRVGHQARKRGIERA